MHLVDFVAFTLHLIREREEKKSMDFFFFFDKMIENKMRREKYMDLHLFFFKKIKKKSILSNLRGKQFIYNFTLIHFLYHSSHQMKNNFPSFLISLSIFLPSFQINIMSLIKKKT